MNHVTGLRLKAVTDYDRPVRELGVQHSHAKRDVALDFPVVLATKQVFTAMLDRSWSEFEVVEQDLFDNLPVEENKFMSLLCAVNTDIDKVKEM